VLFSGIVQPEQLAILTTALGEYCRAEHIEMGTPAYEDAARPIMRLLNNGAFTAEEIGVALVATARVGQ